MEHKTMSGQVALTDAGQVDAIFARLNVKDYDDDVTLPGAFEDGAPVVISAFGHASWGPARGTSSIPALPVGKGRIRMSGDEAHLDGQFFMDTTHGRDTFLTVKALADGDGLGEWSYGYDTVESERGTWNGEKVRFLKRQQVHEVSPVLLGAGMGTRTVAAKSLDQDEIAALEEALANVKAGRVLSAANRDRLTGLLTALQAAGGDIEDLLSVTDPARGDDEAKHRDVMRAVQLAEIARRNSIAIGGLA